MKENIETIIKKICKEQNYDAMLIDLVQPEKNNKIKEFIKKIYNDENMNDVEKREVYEKVFEYVNKANGILEENVEKIFEMGVKKAIKYVTEVENNEKEIELLDTIKIIIADDNRCICDLYTKSLEKHKDVEILGIAHNDEDEINMIENLKPEIVISDLMRPGGWTGLDIIKDYYSKRNGPEFLVISADKKDDVITGSLKVAGYIKKPFENYELIYTELKRIKKQIRNRKIDNEYKEWERRYWNDRIIDLNQYFNKDEFKMIKKLGIKIKNKIYTMQEFCALEYELYLYYEDEDLKPEEQEYKKSLKNTKVSKEDYYRLMNKINEIDNSLYN